MVGRIVRIVAWLLFWVSTGHLWFKHASLQQFRAAHMHDYVLLGDSHADDVRWEGRPRFSGPAQDLYSTLKGWRPWPKPEPTAQRSRVW